MTYLNKLNLTQLKRGARLSPAELRRAKLVAKLEEQLALARAQLEGRSYAVTKHAWTRDADGNRSRVEQTKQVRPWWWQDGDGVAMVVRYGARPLELSKGKRAIGIAQASALPGVIETIVAAVKAGELDAAMDAMVAGTKPRKPRD